MYHMANMRLRTDAPVQAVPVIEGPMTEERWGSVGFRINDETAPYLCRKAAGTMLERFGLTWVHGLVPDVQAIISELVTNVCRYGGDAFPAGSFTLWHPNKWLVLTVHDKNPYMPRKEIEHHALYGDEGGRGLQIVKRLAADHCGELDFMPDFDKDCPGKVARVVMLLPDVVWRNTYRCPFTGRTFTG